MSPKFVVWKRVNLGITLNYPRATVCTEYESGTPGRKANTITTERKKILSNAVVRYCI